MPIDEKQFDRVEAIIGSMTKTERSDPDRIERSGPNESPPAVAPPAMRFRV